MELSSLKELKRSAIIGALCGAFNSMDNSETVAVVYITLIFIYATKNFHCETVGRVCANQYKGIIQSRPERNIHETRIFAISETEIFNADIDSTFQEVNGYLNMKSVN